MNREAIRRTGSWFAAILTFNVLGASSLFAWSNYQPASYVIGEPDFTTNWNNTVGPMAMEAETMLFDAASNRLFVSDTYQGRVLVYDYNNDPHGYGPISKPGRKPDYVIGLPDFTTPGPNDYNWNIPVDETTLVQPKGLAYDRVHQWLYVADSYLNRILVFDLSPTGPGLCDPVNAPGKCSMKASWVIGQLPNEPGPTAFNSYYPSCAMPLDPPYVTDATYPAYGDPPTHCQPAWGGPPAPTANPPFDYLKLSDQGLFFPSGLAYDGTSTNHRLFVADRFNSRVLVYDVTAGPPTLCGSSPPCSSWQPPAIGLLGQPDYRTNNSYPTAMPIDATAVPAPEYLLYDPSPGVGSERLFVGEEGYSRILVFNASSNQSGTNPIPILLAGGGSQSPVSAIHELGQPDMNTSDLTVVDSVHLYGASNFAYDPIHKVGFAADEINNRVLVYDLSKGITDGMPAINVLGQWDFFSSTANISQSAMSHVEDVIYDTSTQTLFEVDTGNSRILAFTPAADCGGLQICGTIATAQEGATAPSIPLPNWPVELRDKSGRLLATKKTGPPDPALGPGAAYRFTTSDSSKLVLNGNYFVTPVVGRTQSAAPTYYPIINVPGGGSQANFQIHGILNSIQVTGQPAMTFVLVTTTPYPKDKADPPNMGPGTPGGGSGFYTGVADKTGTATVNVPAGTSYYVTCWLPQSTAATSITYSRPANTPSQGPYTVSPSQGATAECTK